MDEEQLDSLMRGRPFETSDVRRFEAQARRNMTLAIALWGSTPDDLHRQLSASHPEIPAGFDLADFRDLQKNILRIAATLSDPRNAWLSTTSFARTFFSPGTVVGPERLTAWEARCEIIRRAIEYLEGR